MPRCSLLFLVVRLDRAIGSGSERPRESHAANEFADGFAAERQVAAHVHIAPEPSVSEGYQGTNEGLTARKRTLRSDRAVVVLRTRS